MSGAAEGAGTAVRRAAEAEGVAPDGPLGRLVGALADLGDRWEAGTAQALADMRRVAEADIERSRAAREMAEASARRAEAAVKGLEVETERLQSEVVGKLADHLSEDLKDVLVVVEKTRRDRSLFRLLCLGGAVALVLVGTGAGLAAWRDREAVRFHAACARGVVHDARGNAYCPLRAVLAEEGGRP